MSPDERDIEAECERLISGDIGSEIPEPPGEPTVSPVDIDLQFISIELSNVASTLSSIYATLNAQIAGILGEIRTDLRSIQDVLRESIRETLRESENCCLDIRRELALAITFELQSLYEQLNQWGIVPPQDSPLLQIAQEPSPEAEEETSRLPDETVPKEAPESAAECPEPIGIPEFELCQWQYPKPYEAMAKLRDSGFETFALPPFEFTAPSPSETTSP